MNKPGTFTEEDKDKVVEFLNFIAKNAKFKEVDTAFVIEYFRLLNYMQTNILPKINDNILELKKVVETTSEKLKTKKKK